MLRGTLNAIGRVGKLLWFICIVRLMLGFACRLLGKNGWKDKYGNRYKLADEPIKFYDFNF